MIVENVMDDIGNRLDTQISELRVAPYEADDINPPAAIVSLPANIDYRGTYAQGMNKLIIVVTILFSLVDDRIRRSQIAPYGDGTGSKSIRQVLESGTYTAFHTIAVNTCQFSVVRIAGVDYLAGLWTCEVFGSGTA